MEAVTRTFEVALPVSIPVEEARLMLAAKLFELDRVTLGEAAKLAGYSKRTFMEMLGTMGIPVFKHSTAQLETDLAW
jgi:predicted HTH domain antitoxin